MYQINRPIRIAQKEEDLFLVSLPSIGVRIEVNKNVVEFLEFLVEREPFNDINIIANEFTKRYNITNVQDYVEMIGNMIQIQMLTGGDDGKK